MSSVGVSRILLGHVIVVWLGAFGALRANEPVQPPDLTSGTRVDASRTYNLGATGLRGWIHTHPANFFDSVQGRTTTASRQILITHVGRDTPADGRIEVGDVILGTDGAPFADDARKQVAAAIQKAEEENGELSLLRWRQGATKEVTLSLRSLGRYSATAPYDCRKSQWILDEAVAVLAKAPLEDDLWGSVNGLALMASARSDLLPAVKDLARRQAHPADRLPTGGLPTWDTGYRLIFLCEYRLLTGDTAVMPAIERLAAALARGQGMFGTYGHGFAEPARDGGPHGPIPPYGPVNAAGLVANLALVLARECGAADAEIGPAIERGSRFFGYYSDKGSIPYGEHLPWPYHENNGKNAMAAIFFGVQGDRVGEARFFAKMVTASFRNREYGHTGQGFSYLWGAPGAHVGGQEALAAFFREASWHFDLVRRTDGSFTYDGDEQFGPGTTADDTYFGDSGYDGLNPTACYALTYALPLRTLRITGRRSDPADELTSADVAEAVRAGRFDTERHALPAEALVTDLGNWSPVVRDWAAEELARRPEAKGLAPRLLDLAEGPDPRTAQGACTALGCMRHREAIPVLVRLLSADDPWLRTKAALSLRHFADDATPELPAILGAVAELGRPGNTIDWDDPIQIAHGELAATVFKGLLRRSTEGVDRGLLHPAIRSVARNVDGMARATLTTFLERQATLEDVRALGPDLVEAASSPCPADTMFRNEIRMAAFRALARYRFREAIEAGATLAQTQGGHGSESRTGEIMEQLTAFGTAARDVVPRLRDVITFFEAECAAGGFPNGELQDRRVNAVRDAIAEIESATDAPSLRSLAPSPPPL